LTGEGSTGAGATGKRKPAEAVSLAGLQFFWGRFLDVVQKLKSENPAGVASGVSM
jgi:hypothetical protein